MPLKKSFLTNFILIFTPLVTILALYVGSGVLFENQYDDAYITYRYAANFATEKGLVFNLEERTNSASSFLFTLLLSLLYKIGITNLELSSVILNILSSIGISFFVYKSVLFLTKNSLLGYFLSFITILHGFISGWTISGMETIFFTMLVTAFVYQYYFQKKRSEVKLTLTMILILLTRIEGILLLITWFFSKLYSSFIIKIKKDNKPVFISQLVVFIITILGLYIFYYVYYGSFFPDSFIFKRIAAYYQPNILYLLFVWIATSFTILILFVYSIFLPKQKSLWFLYLYIFLSFVTFAIGPFSDGARYSVHVFPIVIILASLSINYLIAGMKNKKKFIGKFILVLILLQTAASALFTRSYMATDKQGQLCRKELGAYINTNLNDQDYVLSGDIGTIAYHALNVRFIDLSGLTSKDILNSYQQRKPIDDIILHKKPKMLADSFFTDKEGKLIHLRLTNQVESIVGMRTYTNLLFQNTFKDIKYQCWDGKRLYAVIDLESLYNSN